MSKLTSHDCITNPVPVSPASNYSVERELRVVTSSATPWPRLTWPRLNCVRFNRARETCPWVSTSHTAATHQESRDFELSVTSSAKFLALADPFSAESASRWKNKVQDFLRHHAHTVQNCPDDSCVGCKNLIFSGHNRIFSQLLFSRRTFQGVPRLYSR